MKLLINIKSKTNNIYNMKERIIKQYQIIEIKCVDYFYKLYKSLINNIITYRSYNIYIFINQHI